MRTTLDLNEKLLQDAMKISGEKTKTGIIHKLLEEYIDKSDARGIFEYGGKINLDIDLNITRSRF